MNAALKFVCSYWKLRTACSRPYVSTASRNEDYRAKVEALGCGHRVARNAIEFVDKSATKRSHRRKSVGLTTTILNERRPSNIHFHCTRLVTPSMSILGFFQFTNKRIER